MGISNTVNHMFLSLLFPPQAAVSSRSNLEAWGKWVCTQSCDAPGDSRGALEGAGRSPGSP